MASDTSSPACGQTRRTASDISGVSEVGAAAGLTPSLRTAFEEYVAVLERAGGPLDADTVRVYRSRVGRFLQWLAGADIDGEPLVDASARDWAVRDYRTYLLTVAGRKPAFPYERNEEFISLGGGAGEVPRLERRRGG